MRERSVHRLTVELAGESIVDESMIGKRLFAAGMSVGLVAGEAVRLLGARELIRFFSG